MSDRGEGFTPPPEISYWLDADTDTGTNHIATKDEVVDRERLLKTVQQRKEWAEAEALAKGDDRHIHMVHADQVVIKQTYWVWRNRYPLGGLSIVAGKGATSKSTLFACQAAWLSVGDMKGMFYGKPVKVAYIANEDLLNETVVPRLKSHGADLTNVKFLRVKTPMGEDALSFPRDTEMLRRTIIEHELKAVFIDPLSANITGKMNDQGDMRHTYQQVSYIAQSTGCAIIGLAHTRKAGAADIVEAIMGSSELSNVARSVHGLVLDPNDDGVRMLSCEKLNMANMDALPTLRFRLESNEVRCTDGSGELTHQPRIVWLDEVSERASDILGDALNGTDGIDECARWLYDYLVNNGGEAEFHDIKSACKYSESMLKRARKKIGVVSKRTNRVPATSLWHLPL